MMAECDKVGNTGFDDRLGALVIVMAPPVSAHRTPAGSPPATRTSAPRCSQTQCYILDSGTRPHRHADTTVCHRIPGSGSSQNDEKCYFRSTISIQFGCVPIG